MCTPVRIFAYFTVILEAIYNMQRTKKAKGQMWCEGEERKSDEESDEEEREGGERGRQREGERERVGGGGGGGREEGATRLHRSRSTVCKPSSIIKFLLAQARARYTKVVLFLFRIVESCKNSVYRSRIKVRRLLRQEISVTHVLIAWF